MLSAGEISDLQQIIADANDGDEAAVAKLLKRKSITERLQLATGHAGKNWGAWEVGRWTFEDDVHIEALLPATAKIIANVFLNVSEIWMRENQMWLNRLYSTILICSCKQPSWGALLSSHS